MKMISKVLTLSIAFTMAIGLFSSCESTAQEGSAQSGSSLTTGENADNSSKSENTTQFKKEVQDMELTIVSAPEAPVAGTPFAKPYIVSVKNKEGNPYSNYTLTVTYPVSKSENVVNYSTTEIETDENGKASFKPETISTSMNSVITFAPKTPTNNPTLIKLANAVSVEAPCRVRFVLPKGKLVMVYLVDYDSKDRMNINATPSTSSNLLQEIWKRGYPYQAQNGPDLHKYIDEEPQALLKRAKGIIAGGSSMFRYFVSGKVKYDGTITEVAGGFSVTLKATVSVVDFQTGEVVYTTTRSVTATEKSQWQVVNSCQTQLAKELADELVYSL